MKPTELQKKMCDIVIAQASYWKNSNDINSPTHMNDLDEDFNDINLEEIKNLNVYKCLFDLMWAIRELEF